MKGLADLLLIVYKLIDVSDLSVTVLMANRSGWCFLSFWNRQTELSLETGCLLWGI